MDDEHFIVTINKKELRYIICCDCGLCHAVSYDIFENRVDMHFVRDEARTIRARIERKKDKRKNPCEELDEARARENLHPPETPDAVKTEASSIGAILGKGEKWRPQLQK